MPSAFAALGCASIQPGCQPCEGQASEDCGVSAASHTDDTSLSQAGMFPTHMVGTSGESLRCWSALSLAQSRNATDAAESADQYSLHLRSIDAAQHSHTGSRAAVQVAGVSASSGTQILSDHDFCGQAFTDATAPSLHLTVALSCVPRPRSHCIGTCCRGVVDIAKLASTVAIQARYMLSDQGAKYYCKRRLHLFSGMSCLI